MFVANSTMFIAWPEWTSDDAKKRLRSHLTVLREEAISFRNGEASARGAIALPASLDPGKLGQAVAEGKFALHGGKELHPSNVSYDENFRPQSAPGVCLTEIAKVAEVVSFSRFLTMPSVRKSCRHP